MRDEMLFIDGELVDLDEDTKITLNIKSNLFTDLSKIVSNNSYTIKLPKTVRNQRIIEHADLPACNTDYSRKFHQGRYFRNGVEIIPNAKVVLISVGEKIELAMTWGNFVRLSKVIEEKSSLNTLSEKDDYIIWSSGIEINEYGTKDYLVSRINYGFKDENEVTYHPCARVEYVLNLIQERYGINLVYPEDKQQFIQSLLIPLITKNGGYANYLDSKCSFQVRSVQESGGNSLISWTKIDASENYTRYFSFIYAVSSQIIEFVKILIDGKLIIKPMLKSSQNDLVLFYGTSSVYENYKYLQYRVIDGEYPYMYDIPLELDIQANYSFTIGRRNGYAMLFDDLTIEFGFMQTELMLGDKFPIIENLPDIDVIDFLKAISYVCGLFPVSSEIDNNLTFVSVESIKDNILLAKDWTKRVVAAYLFNKPNAVSFSLDGFAQNNYVRWQKDDTVIASYDGILIVEDETIDYENDVIEIPFSASDTLNGIAEVPIYSYDTITGEIEYSELEPRLLCEENDNGKSKATFRALEWESISKYYQLYQSLIRKPIIIKEKIEISDIELREIDVTIPVYLAQYGRYYAIISIKAENTGICECELLQLEV